MKILVLSLALISSSLVANANQYYPNNPNGFNAPNFNWGSNNGGSNWNMPNFNWGSNNGGSNWNMPSMNWGSNNGGSNWSMPSMNWGNNNGYGSGSSWKMPSINWGSGNGYNRGSSWNMPSMNWGNNWNNNTRPWSYGANRPNYRFVPNPAYKFPAPQIKSQALTTPTAPKKAPAITAKPIPAKIGKSIASPAIKSVKTATSNIPKPSDVKGVILAPENKPTKVTPEATIPTK